MNVRCLAGLATFTITASAFAQDVSQSVRFSRAAGLAPAVLSDLSKATKVDMRAAPSVAGDVIYLNLRGVPLTEAMQRIASTIHAQWRKEGEIYVLDRPVGLVEADRREEAVRNAKRLKVGIDKLVAETDKQAPWSEEVARRLAKTYLDAQADYFANRNDNPATGPSAKLQGMANQLPGGRAVIKLLSLLTPAQLETISRQRTVLSSRPNRMQIAMPSGADKVVSQLLAEMRVLDQAMKDAEGTRDRTRIFATGVVSPMEFDVGNVSSPGISILRATTGFTGSDAYFQLTVADTDGETIANGVISVPLSAGSTPLGLEPGANEKPIVLSDAATRYVRALKSQGGSLSTSMMGGGPGEPELVVVTQEAPGDVPSGDFLAQILNPDKFEPMRLAPTEAFEAVANQLDKNVIAYIPDSSLLQIGTALLSGKMVPSNFLNQLDPTCGMTARVEDKWIEAVPLSPTGARRQQVNRVALAKILNLFVKQGYLHLDDLSAFAAQQQTAPAYTRWDRACFMVINAASADHYFGYQNPWWLLRLYGTLTGPQKQTLMAGQQLPIANLSSSQIEMLSAEVFRNGYGVKIARQEKERPGARVSFPGLLDEVTYALPNGITREGYIQVNTAAEPAVQTMSSQTGAISFLPFGGLAWTRLNMDRPDLTTAYGAGGKADKFRMATKSNHSFVFQFGPRVSMTAKLADMAPNKDAQFGAYESLPADFRSMVESAGTRLKDLQNDVSSRRSGAKPPL
jgi:hypothetical protein